MPILVSLILSGDINLNKNLFRYRYLKSIRLKLFINSTLKEVTYQLSPIYPNLYHIFIFIINHV
jgi:hypothetical protein